MTSTWYGEYELKPCPFCGSEGVVEDYNQEFNRLGFIVVCSKNGCKATPWDHGEYSITKEWAIEKWNNRPAESEPQKAREEIEKKNGIIDKYKSIENAWEKCAKRLKDGFCEELDKVKTLEQILADKDKEIESYKESFRKANETLGVCSLCEYCGKQVKQQILDKDKRIEKALKIASDYEFSHEYRIIRVLSILKGEEG